MTDGREEMAKKNFRYNRYLLLRYVLATFFFSNLYWGLSLLLSGSGFISIPMIMLGIRLWVVTEHVRLYGLKAQNKVNLQGNYIYYLCQLLLNGVLMISVLTSIGFTRLFPFLTQNHETKITVSVWLLVGILLSVVCLHRISKIRKNKDKHYSYIQEFEKTML